MRTLRFYHCDKRGHIVRGVNCAVEDEGEAKRIAREFLIGGPPEVQAIEVWDSASILHRVRREDIGTA